jgi:phosphoribosylformylglycinamidine cyclo-ligase
MQRDAYAAAGVDIEAGNRAKDRIRAAAARAGRPEVLAGIGPFAAMFHLGAGYRDPVLVSSTDGVGTKVLLAAAMDAHASIGRDLVNLSVNDILTTGARPLFFLDYIASSSLTEEAKVALVSGMADACAAAGCALIGGETADMPDVYRPGDFDLAGFIVGIVERDAVIDGSRVAAGQTVLMLPSTGAHTNGYSLIRAIWGLGKGDPGHDRAVLERYEPALGRTLGEALLAPHPSYLNEVQPALPHLTAIAHITGGGLIENLPRVLPEGLCARIERHRWQVPPLFRLIAEVGEVEEATMFRTFNMGVGLVLVTPDPDAVRVLVPEARPIGAIEVRPDHAPQVLLS